MRNILLLLPALLVFTLISCKETPTSSTPPDTCLAPEGDALIRVIEPKGGEVYKVGETITVKFSIDVQKVGPVAVLLATDGRQFKEIVEGSIPPTKTKGIECLEYSYVLQAENVPEATTAAKIKVWKYNENTINAVSGAFSINP